MGRSGLGPIGFALNVSDHYLEEAAELERLGYSAVWLPGGQLDRLDRLTELSTATKRVAVAPAVISLDLYPADQVVRLYAQLEGHAPGRLQVGLGGPQRSPKPLQALNGFLDRLDRAEPRIPAQRRLLAALGPRKLELARTRAAGAITLLVTPEYTGAARQALGADRTLIVDQMLVLDTDPARAREAARGSLRFLGAVPGYRQNFARMGFSEDEIAALDDRLVDELVVWGEPKAIVRRVEEHSRAGADHVFLTALQQGGQPGPIEVARELAPLLPR